MNEAMVININKLHKIIESAKDQAIEFSDKIRELSASLDHSKTMALPRPNFTYKV